jgi:hypothetical protein
MITDMGITNITGIRIKCTCKGFRILKAGKIKTKK